MPLRHILKISDLSPEEFTHLIDLSIQMKANPEKYTSELKGQTLLAMFAKPSLRTRVSLETAMTKLGGHCIYYQLGAGAPLGVKETVADTSKCISRMVDVCTARLPSKEMVGELAANATIPVINALDDWAHPLQMVADFQCIKEKFGSFKGLTFLYAGDSLNNVTYDLMRSCVMLGMNIHVACPDNVDYSPHPEVIAEVEQIGKTTGGTCKVFHNMAEAARGVDIVYADSWFSYGIPIELKEERTRWLEPFRVTKEVMDTTSEKGIFMNCLPAARGFEQTAEVIDGPRSVVFDEAENRLWSAMATLSWCVRQNK
eukprot:gnl/Dysnectes_brevis/329_a364_8827.p1 GENE.gnl/Dysnectes_brevis/329_a364_8827~~gnl/Dysnectes_brevis/329_a364_8827.p1  ORF type:complete len:314 (+),score=82.33 gnl/Dysnectes_brevis/329_a364_8827:26-967(+)